MSYRTVEESSLTGIADAIREAGGTGESLLFPDDFLTAISNMGGTGGTLTVTAPAGSTVTVSKAGKTLTRVAGADGAVVFRGLETGTWTLSITDGTQTASKTVEIVADYATTITFFAATINITYPAGSTCTVTDGKTTLMAPDTSGTWACVVPNAGTWTVAVTNGYSYPVSINENGQNEDIDLTKYWLFKGNKMYDARTGGWKTAGPITTDYTQNDVSFTDGGAKQSLTNGANKSCYMQTNKAVDLTGFGSLVFTKTGTVGASDNYVSTKDKNPEAWKNMAAKLRKDEPGTGTINVSGLTGEYYVFLGHYMTSGNPTAYVTEVYLA